MDEVGQAHMDSPPPTSINRRMECRSLLGWIGVGVGGCERLREGGEGSMRFPLQRSAYRSMVFDF